MKRILALLLTLALALALCACGGANSAAPADPDETSSIADDAAPENAADGTEPAQAPEKTPGNDPAQASDGISDSDEQSGDDSVNIPASGIRRVGDTVTAGSLEFTLESVEFYKCLRNVGDPDYMNPVDPDAEDADRFYTRSNPYYAIDSEIAVRIAFLQKNVGTDAIPCIHDSMSPYFKLVLGSGEALGSGAFGTASENRADGGKYSFDFDLAPTDDPVPGRGGVTVPIRVMEDTSQPLYLVFSYGGEAFWFQVR